MKVFNFSLEKDLLCDSTQENVTRILYKKGDKKLLKRWRSMFLLNDDYIICSKSLANRQSKVLSVINKLFLCLVGPVLTI